VTTSLLAVPPLQEDVHHFSQKPHILNKGIKIEIERVRKTANTQNNQPHTNKTTKMYRENTGDDTSHFEFDS